MQTPIFLAVILTLSLLDILYTFYNVDILRKHKKHWEDTEYNPLVRTSWHILGLLKGSVMAGVITLIMILIIAVLISLVPTPVQEFYQGLLIGAYLMLHMFHYMNYAYISKRYLKKEKNVSLLERFILEH